MEKYIAYLDGISVDAEMHERTMKRLNQKLTTMKRLNQKLTRPPRKRAVYRYTGLAACAVMLVLCVLTLPSLLHKPALKQPVIPGEIDASLTGLPVDNFSLSDMDVGAEMDRMLLSKLSDFFSYNPPELFAFVRVTGTEQWKDKNPAYGGAGDWKQTSSVYILSAVWSRGGEAPEALLLTQTLYGGCVGEEMTNLLREGGVYLLPLSYWRENDTWYVNGDLDVLFEVDDGGRVWSHSQYGGFSRFDGQDAGVLADAVTALTSDADFPAAITPFGQIARHWGVLAEVTVMSEARDKDRLGNDRFRYTLRADGVLSGAPDGYAQPDRDQLYAISGVSGYLEPGGRYLMLLDPSGDGPYIEPGRVAKIGENGTITGIPPTGEDTSYTNIFAEFGGRTPGQMLNELERARAWQERCAK